MENFIELSSCALRCVTNTEERAGGGKVECMQSCEPIWAKSKEYLSDQISRAWEDPEALLSQSSEKLRWSGTFLGRAKRMASEQAAQQAAGNMENCIDQVQGEMRRHPEKYHGTERVVVETTSSFAGEGVRVEVHLKPPGQK